MAIYCTQCGTSLPDDAIFCLKCGKQLKERGPSPEHSSVDEKYQHDAGDPPTTVRSSKNGYEQKEISARKAESHQVWPWLILVGFIVVAAVVVYYGWATQQSSSTNSSNSIEGQTSDQSTSQPSGLSSDAATQVFANMGNAVKNKDWTTLYNMTSSDYQVHLSQSDMVHNLSLAFDGILFPNSSGGTDQYSSGAVTITNVSVGPVSIQTRNNSTFAEGRMTWTFSDGRSYDEVAILISENGMWKVNKILPLYEA